VAPCRRTFRNAKWPTFWLPKGPAGLHEYDLRTIWHRLPLPLAAPVIVNSHEARAFAAWRTRSISAPTPLRLLSEAEHHRLLGACGHAAAWAALPPPSGAALKARAAANLQLAYGAEVPVTVAGGAGPFVGVRGNVWHWCEDWMAALPGNRGFHPFYDDFSMPCYDGQHALIMGGSFMSTGSVATATARFHFRPHFHQHAGFRLARCFAPGTSPPLTHIDSPPPHVGSWNPSSRAASAAKPSSVLPQALLAAFQCKPPLAPPAGTPAAWLDFPAALVEVLRAAVSGRSDRKGHMLEVGCGVGGVAFKAAELFDSVMGIDLSADAIAAAQHLQSQGCLPFECDPLREHAVRCNFCSLAGIELLGSNVQERTRFSLNNPSKKNWLKKLEIVVRLHSVCHVYAWGCRRYEWHLLHPAWRKQLRMSC
jgi:hypothetical protein